MRIEANGQSQHEASVNKRFEVFTAVRMMMMFWAFAPCRHVGGCHTVSIFRTEVAISTVPKPRTIPNANKSGIRTFSNLNHIYFPIAFFAISHTYLSLAFIYC
jgi:hypothetical protein